MSVALSCPVRGCGNELLRDENRYYCAERHSFDVSRDRFVNLLQPQDRKAAEPGDARAAVQARARLLDHFGDPVVAPLAAAVRKIARKRPILDVGCGVGYHLEHLRLILQSPDAVGVDLSSAAVERAARRYRECEFIIANADRRIPIADASFAAIFSITARRNREEMARLVTDDGWVVVVVPAADDLIELRRLAQGEGVLRERIASVIEEMAPTFSVADTFTLSRTLTLDRVHLHDLLAATYRGARKSEQERLTQLGSLRVTMSRDAILFRKT